MKNWKEVENSADYIASNYAVVVYNVEADAFEIKHATTAPGDSEYIVAAGDMADWEAINSYTHY